jgi:hypothetical protein
LGDSQKQLKKDVGEQEEGVLDIVPTDFHDLGKCHSAKLRLVVGHLSDAMSIIIEAMEEYNILAAGSAEGIGPFE